MGRHSKISQEITEKVCASIADGVPLEFACEAAGIHRRTLERWRARGDEELESLDEDSTAELSMYAVFCRETKSALARCVEKHVSIISKSAYGKPGEINWQAAAWILERRWPASFGKRTILEMPSTDVVGRIGAMSDEQLRAIITRGG